MLLFLLIIFLGTLGDAEFLCKKEGEDIGPIETLTFGDCLALLQLITDDKVDGGPALEDLTSSVLLLLLAISMPTTIKTSKLIKKNAANASSRFEQASNGHQAHTRTLPTSNCSKLFCFSPFVRSHYPTFKAQPPLHSISLY